MPIARHPTLVSLLAVVAGAGFSATAWPHPALASVIIGVNTAVDEDVDDASCSLREAIIAANTNVDYHGCLAAQGGSGDKIVFTIGSGTPTINIGATPLPAITEAVIIDGGDGRVELHGPGGPPVSGHHGLTVNPSGFGTIIRHLVVNNSADDGILINADEVSVFGCFVGTDATGMMAVPNQGFGIQVFGHNGTRIGGATSGGPCTGDCNVISGATNFKANVLLDLQTTLALVRGNFIGTNVTGTAAITPNDVQGIVDKGASNRIGGINGTTPGGACTGDCNLISGNNINGGVVIDVAATHSMVQGNFIGTDVTGNLSISNGQSEGFSEGILSYAVGATIGGTIPAARNVVSGNKGTGVQVEGINTIVQGNYLGTNSAGTAPVPNSGPGVTVYQADSAMIGGTAPGAGNLISGSSNNGAFGVEILQSGNTHVVGNLIGTAADGITPLPNQLDGVFIFLESQQNIIGGQNIGAGNLIAFNGRDGVRVDNSVPAVRGNTIRGNSIYANDAAGIELVSGGNDSLAPPTIDGIAPLHGTSCAPCAVEIFSDSDDQGRVLEGTVFTNDGNWAFDGPLSGPNVTATSTDMSNNTSPFSAPFALPSPTPTASPSLSPTSMPPTSTRTRTRTATSTATATNVLTVTRTRSATATASRTATATASATAVVTDTRTPTSSASATQTRTRTAPATATATNNSTVAPTRSTTPTVSRTAAATASATAVATATRTVSSSATATQTRIRTATATATATTTSTVTATRSTTPSASRTATAAASATAVATVTRTVSSSTTATQTRTRTAASTATSTSASSATATPSATATVSRTATVTAINRTPTSTAAPSITPTKTTVSAATSTATPPPDATPTPTPTVVPCTGDCNGDRMVSVNELILGVGIALGTEPASACPALENSQGQIDVAQIIAAVSKAVNGCSDVT